MTPQCKKVLKILIKLSDRSECLLSFCGPSDFCICQYSNLDIEYNFSAFSKEFHGILQQLSRDGFLHFDSDTVFHLTHKGLHRFWIRAEEFITFLYRSILVPIVVSVLASIITTYILFLFSGSS